MEQHFSKKGFLPKVLMIISALTIFTFTSCKKEEKVTNNDSYYVKYVINGNGAYGRFSDWTATTPQETYTNNGYQTRSWNQTFGPIHKGFKCEVQIGNYISGAPSIEIHVSKNQEAFALKVNKTGSSASYTVDF
jgi:hypothetical protein